MKNLLEFIKESSDDTKSGAGTNLKKADDVIAYAKTLSDFTFNDEETGWDKNGKAFSLTNKNGLKMIVDFANNSEYVYDFEDKDGNSLYSKPSTADTSETDWKVLLNPKTWADKRISELKSSISKYEGLAKRAKTQYDRYDRSSDYQKYLDNKKSVQSLNNKLEKVKKIASLA